MDIEDIERHKYNFRLFSKFLKQKHLYQTFKKIIFTNNSRTPYDLFILMNKTNITSIISNIGKGYCITDRKWSAIFTYIPFSRIYWDGKKGEINSYTSMSKLSTDWCYFLEENNYDNKIIDNGNITFKLNGRPFKVG